MLSLNQSTVEQILSALDNGGYLFPQFELYKVNNQPQLLGKGGFAVVYEMVNKERPEFHFALKVIGLEKHVVTSEKFWTTCRYQAILCQESSNIMRVLDARELHIEIDDQGIVTHAEDSDTERWDEDGLHLQFVLMEKLSHILTRDRFKKAVLQRNVLSDEAEVIRFAMQIGQALALAHRYSILHRDVKLENIFWDDHEQCYKLGDFGIAKFVEGGNAETIVYTDGYGAPEIERRLYDYYNATADIYSLGITLYLLLNGLKFPGSEGYYTKAEVQYNSQFVFPAPENASEEMTRVIRKMCSYNAEDRYQSMAEVLVDLACVSQMDGLDEADEFMELADIATETYRKEKTEDVSQEKREKNKTRAERKEEQKTFDAIYREDSVKYLIGLTILLTLLIKGMQPDTSAITSWLFWTIPIALMVEAVLQRMKEFHIFFGALIVIFSTFSIYSIGLTFPHIILMMCVLIGVPVLSISGATATGLWMLLELTDKLKFLDQIEKLDLGWILLILVFWVINRLFNMRIIWEKTTYIRAFLGVYIYDKMFLVMIAAGIVLLVLQHFGTIEIPEIINKIHFIRTGIITYAGLCFIMWWNGELGDHEAVKESGDEEVKDDVQMDE